MFSRRIKRSAFICGMVLLSFALVLPAFALGGSGGYVALPPKSGDTELRQMVVRRSPLEINVGYYRSGKLAVKVRNKSQQPAKFVPDGLYFIPVLPESEMPGSEAARRIPQRVVVAGLVGHKNKSVKRVTVGGNKTVSITLPVFCLDAHRPSPRTGQVFRVAQNRLPVKLSRSIVSGATSIEQQHDGVVKLSRIQGHVWKVRAQDWVVLEGELPNEQVIRKSHQQAHPETGNVDQPQLKLY